MQLKWAYHLKLFLLKPKLSTRPKICIMVAVWQEKGFTKIAFASQVAQTSFMKQFRRKFKLKLDMLPLVTDSLRKYSFEFKPLDASKAINSDFVSIEKRQSIIKRFLGTRGSKVKREMRKEKRQARKKRE